jgi:monovalent cation/hydrogen antiporter
MNTTHATQLVLLILLLFVVVFGVLAQRLKVAYPIVLVIAGLLLGFVPGIPKITLDPELILFVVLPPLLYSAAWVTSWQDFSRNIGTISSLAVGLVTFTVFGVAVAAPLLFAGFDWRLGFLLGAVVAPTDSVAASSIASQLGLPKRVTIVLEGESLVNDATGLLALEFGVAMLLGGETPTVLFGIGRFIYLALAGISVGLVLGWFVQWFEQKIDDAAIEVSVSILVPYAAFLVAERLHGSGILAVVAAGLYLSRKSSQFFSPSVRLQAVAVWNSITFILNGLVFVLIGLQLPYVLQGIQGISLKQLVIYGGLFSLLLIALRLLWTFPRAYFSYLFRTRILHREEQPPRPRELFVIGWTGMRGVVALAAAVSLPQRLPGNNLFPERNLIIFLTFCVILVTLVLQGLTLPQLIRLLGLSGASREHCGEEEARRLVLEAALHYLENHRPGDASPLSELYDDLIQHYKRRIEGLNRSEAAENENGRTQYLEYLHISRELLQEERKAALQLRNEGRIDDDVLRELEHELDLSETRMNLAMEHGNV